MAVLFISIGWMTLRALTLDNADRICALGITPGIHLHHVEVADQDTASGNLLADLVISYLFNKQLIL